MLLAGIFLGLYACEADSGFSDNMQPVEPPRPMMDMVLLDEHFAAYPADLLRGQWSLIIPADHTCAEACEHFLRISRQAAEQFGPESGVQRLLVLGYEPSTDWLEQFRQDYPDVKIAVLTRSVWSIFSLQLRPALLAIAGQGMVVVNPDARLVMAYDDFAEAADLVNDLALAQP